MPWQADQARVIKDAEALRNTLVNGTLSPITYNSPKPREILEEDKVIQAYPINIKPADVTVVPVEDVFQ